MRDNLAKRILQKEIITKGNNDAKEFKAKDLEMTSELRHKPDIEGNFGYPSLPHPTAAEDRENQFRAFKAFRSGLDTQV